MLNLKQVQTETSLTGLEQHMNKLPKIILDNDIGDDIDVFTNDITEGFQEERSDIPFQTPGGYTDRSEYPFCTFL